MGWRDNDAMASAAMASLADGGSGNDACCPQLCSGNNVWAKLMSVKIYSHDCELIFVPYNTSEKKFQLA